MAVPPIQRSPKAAAAGPTPDVRFPWLLDAVLGLLILAALPLAIVAIPNTVSVVADLLPDGIDRIGLMRAHGLALPAMMLTVPLAAVALRRIKVAHVLVGGLALLAVADAAGGFAGSAFLVGVLRVLHGVGAGLLVPATLVAAWERPPLLRGLWTGMLALSLVAAQALALWPLDGTTSWRITLQPYPMLTGIALALAAAYFLIWVVRGEQTVQGPRAKEGSRLMLAAVPAAGIAFVAISTANENWPPVLVILLAVVAIAAMLALASIGAPEGRTWAYGMVAVGTVVLPSVAQITYVEMGGLGGPGLKGLWLPFCVAGVLAVAAAILVRRFGSALTGWLTPVGLLAIVVGLCSVRVFVPAETGTILVIPFTLLAVGAATAMTAALRGAGLGAALFGLALCFPGVLAGYLLGTGIQVMVLQGARTAQALVDGFVAALHLWALIGGFLVVAMIVLAALLARRSASSGTAGAPDVPEPRNPEPDSAGRTQSASTDGAVRGGEEGAAEIMATVRARAGRDAQTVETQAVPEQAPLTSKPVKAETKPPAVRAEAEPSAADRAETKQPRVSAAETGQPKPSSTSTTEAGQPSSTSSAEASQPVPSSTAEAEAPTHPEPKGSQDGAGEVVVPEDDERDRATGEIPRITLPAQVNGVAEAVAESTGPIPAVPPPTPSPEDGT